MRPSVKISSVAILGAPAAVLVAWILGQFGLTMDPKAQAALGTLVGAVIGYLVPEPRVFTSVFLDTTPPTS